MAETNNGIDQSACEHHWIIASKSPLSPGGVQIAYCKECGITADKIQCDHDWEPIPYEWNGYYDDYGHEDRGSRCKRCNLTTGMVADMRPPTSSVWAIGCMILMVVILIAAALLCRWLKAGTIY